MKSLCLALVALALLLPASAEAAGTHHKRSRRPHAPFQPAHRDSQEVLPVPASPQEVETRLTGNWHGLRAKLSDHGVDLAVIYKGEVNRVVHGGKELKTVYLDNLDLRLGLDVEKLAGLKGGSAFFYGLVNNGRDPTQFAGDAQGSSNIEAKTTGLRLFEAWYQQLLYKDQVSLLVGLHDLNSEFYVTENSGLFLNSSFGVGKELAQTGVNGPSIFASAAPSVRLRAEPSKSFYLQGAVFDAQAGNPQRANAVVVTPNAKHGRLFIAEAAYQRGLGEEDGKLAGKYGVGVWNYSRTFDHQYLKNGDVPVQASSHGTYFLLEQAATKSFSGFLRYGLASSAVNRFGSCLSAGVVYTGLAGERDRLGLGVTRAKNGKEYLSLQESQATATTPAETAFELTYRFEIRPGVSLQPDFQYIQNPNTDPLLGSARVAALRFELNF